MTLCYHSTLQRHKMQYIKALAQLFHLSIYVMGAIMRRFLPKSRSRKKHNPFDSSFLVSGRKLMNVDCCGRTEARGKTLLYRVNQRSENMT